MPSSACHSAKSDYNVIQREKRLHRIFYFRKLVRSSPKSDKYAVSGRFELRIALGVYLLLKIEPSNFRIRGISSSADELLSYIASSVLLKILKIANLNVFRTLFMQIVEVNLSDQLPNWL